MIQRITDLHLHTAGKGRAGGQESRGLRGQEGRGLIIKFIERDGELHWSDCGSFSPAVGIIERRSQETEHCQVKLGKLVALDQLTGK